MEKALLSIILIMTLTGKSFGQSIEIHQTTLDNESNRGEMGSQENIHCNPVLLNGQPLEYEGFNIGSKGELTLVKGDPYSPEAIAIPFYVQLRRNGSILRSGGLRFLSYELFGLEISQILLYAKQGDHLIISPSRPVDWKAKRIIELKDPGC